MLTKPLPIKHAVPENPAIPPGLDFVEEAPSIPAAAPRVQLRAKLRDDALGLRNRFGGALLRAGLQHREFTVLSNDCWAQALYEGYGLPCQTPLAGSGMHADCFLRFLGDIEGYLRSPLRFIAETRYAAVKRLRGQREAQSGLWPIAVLGEDVEVHFLHYRSEDESRRAWDMGCERLNLKRIAVKFSVDKDGATQNHI